MKDPVACWCILVHLGATSCILVHSDAFPGRSPRDLRGGVLGGPGESRGALPGTSGERGWGALRGSPGELSLGPRGRRFGSSGGVPGGALQGTFPGTQNGVPQELKNIDFDRKLFIFSPFPEPPCNPTGTASGTVSATVSATVSKMLFIYPRLLGRIQVPGVARKPTKQPGHPTPTTRR